jgi:prepilin-type N-terminal cleavage/methylation domain-containing protein
MMRNLKHENQGRRRGAFRKGLTLVEVLVVVALLAIAGALVVPAMGTTGVLRVQGAIRQVVADLTFAQSDAMAFQQGRAIMFDVTNNSYRIVQIVNGTIDSANTLYDGTTIGKRYTVSLNNPDFGGARITSVTFNNSSASGGNTNNWILDELGTPVVAPDSNAPTNGGVIRIEGQDSVHDILIEPYTGRITVRRVSGG